MSESQKLKKVVNEFGKEFQKYACNHSELSKQKTELEKKLEKVNGKLDVLKEPDWVKGIIEPIVKEMLKQLPGMEYDYWEPHGADRILTVYFYPKGRKTAEEVLTGKETLAISFVAGDLTKGEIFVKDFTEDSGVFKKGSAEYFNGWNYSNVPIILDVYWLINWLRNQNRTSSCISRGI